MAVTITGDGINYGTTGPTTAATITGFTGGVWNAVWNDYVDVVPVNDDAVIEPGYAYIFDGEKYYKSEEYGDCRFFGFDSDTYGQGIGFREGNVIRVPVAGFILAYVDKEYRPGTPLTCTEGGRLTELGEDLLKADPKILVASYWKPEREPQISDGTRTIDVNGRHWVRVR